MQPASQIQGCLFLSFLFYWWAYINFHVDSELSSCLIRIQEEDNVAGEAAEHALLVLIGECVILKMKVFFSFCSEEEYEERMNVQRTIANISKSDSIVEST